MNRDPFAAIADPTRREIIGFLAKDPANINQIAAEFPLVSRQAITKQILYLEESGLVQIQKSGRERYCYLTLENLAEVNRWLQKYEIFWKEKLDQLGEYLEKQNHRKGSK